MKNYSIFLSIYCLVVTFSLFAIPCYPKNLIHSFSAPNDRCDKWGLQFKSLQSYWTGHFCNTPSQTFPASHHQARTCDGQFRSNRLVTLIWLWIETIILISFSFESEIRWRWSADLSQSGDVPHRRPQYFNRDWRLHSPCPEFFILGGNFLESPEVNINLLLTCLK